MRDQLVRFAADLLAVLGLALAFGQSAIGSDLESMVLGGDLRVAEEFLRSEFGATPIVLLSSCADVSSEEDDSVYVLVATPSRERGFILKVLLVNESKWVISNIGELAFEQIGLSVVEAHGGLATYEDLRAHAEFLNKLKLRAVEKIELSSILKLAKRCCLVSS